MEWQYFQSESGIKLEKVEITSDGSCFLFMRSFWDSACGKYTERLFPIGKYGKPIEDTGDTCSFRDGDKKIGLVFTTVLGGKPQLYINAYRIDLLDKDLPEEMKKLEAQRGYKKMESL